MILKRGRVLLKIGDTMRVLCCLLLVWSALLSGCGESKEDAVAPITKSDGTDTFDEQPKTANESKTAVVVTAKKPDDTVALDETTEPTKISQEAAVAAIKELGCKVQINGFQVGEPVIGVFLRSTKVSVTQNQASR
jgi:hypothetical protein